MPTNSTTKKRRVVVEDVPVEEIPSEKDSDQEVIDAVSEAPKAETTEVLRAPTLNLTPQQIQQKDDIKKDIDLYDTQSLIAYGGDTGSEIASISKQIMQDQQLRSLQGVGQELNTLLTTLETGGASGNETGMLSGLKKWFKKQKNQGLSVDDVIGKIETLIDSHVDTLDNYIPLLEELMGINEQNFYDLRLYIVAGKEKIEEMEAELAKQAEEFMADDGKIDEFEQGKLNELQTNINIFRQKLFDLEGLQKVAFLNYTELNSMKTASSMMKMKMEAAKVSTVPMLRMQGVMAAINTDIKSIVQSSQAITDHTQTIIKANAEAAGDVGKGAATEFQRPVVEGETLQYVFKSIVDSFKEIAKIAENGEKKRLQDGAKVEKILEQLPHPELYQLEAPKEKEGKK